MPDETAKSARRRADTTTPAVPADPERPVPTDTGPEATAPDDASPAPLELAGEELEEAVREAGIEGRASMTADQKRTALAAHQAREAEAPVAEGGGSFDKSYLIANGPQLFGGLETWVLAGALNSLPDTVTMAEAQAAVNRFTNPDAPVEG